jgi:hypothetical protein
MEASIIRIQSALSFLINQNLICYCRSQIFELRHIFISSVICFYVVILPFIPAMRHEHRLSFLFVYFLTNLFTSTN